MIVDFLAMTSFNNFGSQSAASTALLFEAR
jgi:hypothetical protein